MRINKEPNREISVTQIILNVMYAVINMAIHINMGQIRISTTNQCNTCIPFAFYLKGLSHAVLGNFSTDQIVRIN